MRLYKEENRVFPFEDYDALLDEYRKIGAKSVLEFGPGASTLAAIESGCDVVSCECDGMWYERALERFAKFGNVRIVRYVNATRVEMPKLRGTRFDVAFVDSPNGRLRLRLKGQEKYSRLNTMECALEHAPVVLLHDAGRPGEQATLNRLREKGFRAETIGRRAAIARVES